MKNKILVTFEPLEKITAELQKEFEIIQDANVPTTERVIEVANAKNPDALFVANGQSYAAETIAKLPKSLKVIATCSVGFEHIDTKACEARNILVTNTPDVLTEACADHAMFVLLGAARRGKEALKLVHDGWNKKLQQGDILGFDLKGKRLGILGMGRIGQAFAHRALAFGMEILYSNRHRLPPEQENGAKYFKTLHEMLPLCDFLSLHAPGGPETKGLMGKKEFSLLPDRAVFVNIARGTLVDEDALIAALDSQKVFAAGLDVCLNEPNPDPRLIKHPKVFLTPHIASATEETRLAMGERGVANLRAALRGEKPKDLVTK